MTNPGNSVVEHDEENPHVHVRLWQVHAEDIEGNCEATIGRTVVTDVNPADELATVDTFVSLIDGAIVVQVDTHGEKPVPVRVVINDGDPVFDDTVA